MTNDNSQIKVGYSLLHLVYAIPITEGKVRPEKEMPESSDGSKNGLALDV